MTTLRNAVSAHIQDGDVVFVGGFGQCVPFAIAHEIIRAGRRRLTLCRTGADIVFDLLIAAGCVSKVIAGYVGNPGIGLAHAFRRAVETGEIEHEFWTNFSMALRLHAGALGVPYIPAALLAEGDIGRELDIHSVTCPYTGRTFTAIPALEPDVAIIHAQRADARGNIQIDGLPGDTPDGALASRRIVATVEEIVSSDVIRAAPGTTIIPAFRVSAVIELPNGALPSYVHGYYGRDDTAYREWDTISRDPVLLKTHIASILSDRED